MPAITVFLAVAGLPLGIVIVIGGSTGAPGRAVAGGDAALCGGCHVFGFRCSKKADLNPRKPCNGNGRHGLCLAGDCLAMPTSNRGSQAHETRISLFDVTDTAAFREGTVISTRINETSPAGFVAPNVS